MFNLRELIFTVNFTGVIRAFNQLSQEQLIRQALKNAQVKPEDISYIEAHGTGTSLGDPIELGALSTVFAKNPHPVWVGSVKTNIGHLEAAAGIAGLMKVILCLQHRQIAPHLHFRATSAGLLRGGSRKSLQAQPWKQETSVERPRFDIQVFQFRQTRQNRHHLEKSQQCFPF